jgi:hypothetical protein
MNNYGFRIISNSNPINKQNISTLSVNYCSLPAPKMARRIKEFNINKKITYNKNGLNKEQIQALNNFNSVASNEYYYANLIFDNATNTLQCFAPNLQAIPLPSITLKFDSVIDKSTNTTIVLDENFFPLDYNDATSILSIGTDISQFDFTNYKITCVVTGYNSTNNTYITYYLTYT